MSGTLHWTPTHCSVPLDRVQVRFTGLRGDYLLGYYDQGTFWKIEDDGTVSRVDYVPTLWRYEE